MPTARVFISRNVEFDENVFPKGASKSEMGTFAGPDETIFRIENNKLILTPETKKVEAQPTSGGKPSADAVIDFLPDPSNKYDENRTTLPLESTTGMLKRSQRQSEKGGFEMKCNKVQREEEYQEELRTVREALSSPVAEEWRLAIREEIDNLQKRGTWKLVPRPAKARVIDSKWVFKTKYNSQGEIERRRARLVAHGYAQQYGIEYTETYAPVIRHKSVRMLLAIAAERGWKVRQINISAAYLHGTLDETVYMEIPDGF